MKLWKLSAVAFAAVVALNATNLAYGQSLDDMISPVSNPVNFEDPRIQTDVRPIFAYHKIDDKFVTQGGDAQIWALQLRYAINERLAFIATKDGLVDFNPDAVLNNEVGFANLAGGFKYAFYADKESGSIFTGGLRFEAPTGSEKVLQGKGDGVFNTFISGATVAGPVNIMATTGFRLPISDHDSTFYDADIHFDTKLGWFYPLLEFNLVHVLDAGDRLPIPDEGQDFFNFGSSLADGKTMLTGAVGGRARISKDVDFGVAYQFPIAQGQGTHITDWRLTADFVLRFDI